MKTTSHAQTAEKLVICDTHPMGRAIRLLGDMWTLMIVYTLLSGPKRFGELLDALGNVSPKTLSQRLKMLEEKGLALVDVIKAIDQFAMRYLTDSEQTSSSSPSTPQSCE